MYWKIVKMLIKGNGNKCNMIPPLKSNNNGSNSILTSDLEQANGLNDYFVSISNVDATNTKLPTFTRNSNVILQEVIIIEKGRK